MTYISKKNYYQKVLSQNTVRISGMLSPTPLQTLCTVSYQSPVWSVGQTPVWSVTQTHQNPLYSMSASHQNPLYSMSVSHHNPLYSMSVSHQNPLYSMSVSHQNPLYNMSVSHQNPLDSMSVSHQNPLYSMSVSHQNPIYSMSASYHYSSLWFISQALVVIPVRIPYILWSVNLLSESPYGNQSPVRIPSSLLWGFTQLGA